MAHMYGVPPHMTMQPMSAPGHYVHSFPSPLPPNTQYMDLTPGAMQYIPPTTDQYNSQMQVQASQYVYPPQYHPPQPQLGHGFTPTGAPPPQVAPQQQLFQPPPPHNMPTTYATQQPRGPSMSRSTSVASDLSHPQPIPPPVLPQTPATPSPAPKDENSPIVRPKKSFAIKIVNPETRAEVKFTKAPPAVNAPERSPSPAVKSSPAKTVPRVTHSPAPSLDLERPVSAQKSKEELTEEMKAKIANAIVKEQVKKKEKEEAERLRQEKKMEEQRRAKEEAERVEREKKEEEEKKRKEQERIKREEEEAERKAEEERIAAQKAKEEEKRLAEEKAKEAAAAAAAAAAQLAKEKEEAEAKAKEEAEVKARKEAEAKAKEEADAKAKEEADTKAKEEADVDALTASADSMSVEERRPSLGGIRRTAPPPITIKSDTFSPDGLQSAALKTANFIKQEEFLRTTYPTGFNSPDPAINAKFGPKGFHYNVEFLYQFKDIYRDKPSSDWDSRIKETMGDMDNRNQRPIGGAPRAVSTSGFQHQAMGTFGIGVGTKPTARPTGVLPSLSTGGYNPINQSFPPRPPRQASTSGQGIQSPASPSARTQSKSQRQSSRRGPPQPPPPPAEPPIEPLPVNPNRWKPQRTTESSLGPPPSGLEANRLSPEVVQRKVKSLLNKLTLEKFDKITDQILEIAGQSRTETDGRTLRQIIQLTFEKATDEPNFSEMYALFCRKIMETIDPNITDPAVLNKDGQPLTGGQLFRKYLLNRCQEEFERGWKVNLPPKPADDATGKEAELLSEAYYTAAKAKRQGLGLVQFIGELFKLNMLIEKIMYTTLSFGIADCRYECIIRLLGGTDNPRPEPEEVESLCRLLNTVGKALDEGKAKTRMNAIYDALEQIRLASDLESRIKFKILDVLDLRKAGWVGRTTGQQGPKTIQEIHDDVRVL